MPPATQSLPHRRITGGEREKCRHDYAKRYGAGSSIRRIAEDTGRSYGFVHRILVEAGVTLRRRGGPRVRPHPTAVAAVTGRRGVDDLVNSRQR